MGQKIPCVVLAFPWSVGLLTVTQLRALQKTCGSHGMCGCGSHKGSPLTPTSTAANHLHQPSTTPHLCPPHRNTTGTREDMPNVSPCHIATKQCETATTRHRKHSERGGKGTKGVEHNRQHVQGTPALSFLLFLF